MEKRGEFGETPPSVLALLQASLEGGAIPSQARLYVFGRCRDYPIMEYFSIFIEKEAPRLLQYLIFGRMI